LPQNGQLAPTAVLAKATDYRLKIDRNLASHDNIIVYSGKYDDTLVALKLVEWWRFDEVQGLANAWTYLERVAGCTGVPTIYIDIVDYIETPCDTDPHLVALITSPLGTVLTDAVKSLPAECVETLKKWARELMKILSEINSRGVIHRDIKPHNIIVHRIISCISSILEVLVKDMKRGNFSGLMHMLPEIHCFVDQHVMRIVRELKQQSEVVQLICSECHCEFNELKLKDSN
jgi:serine/threonine protein kinase